MKLVSSAVWIGTAWRAIMVRGVEGLSSVPLIGSIVGSYAARNESGDQQYPEKLSKKVSGFFERWSIEFSAEYYDAKDGEAAKCQPCPRPP